MTANASGSYRTDKPFRAAQHVVSAQQEDATILLDVRGGEYYTLNGVGGRVWTLLSQGATVGSIIEQLRTEFDVPVEQLSRDVEAFVEQLQRSRLVTH